MFALLLLLHRLPLLLVLLLRLYRLLLLLLLLLLLILLLLLLLLLLIFAVDCYCFCCCCRCYLLWRSELHAPPPTSPHPTSLSPAPPKPAQELTCSLNCHPCRCLCYRRLSGAPADGRKLVSRRRLPDPRAKLAQTLLVEEAKFLCRMRISATTMGPSLCRLEATITASAGAAAPGDGAEAAGRHTLARLFALLQAVIGLQVGLLAELAAVVDDITESGLSVARLTEA